MRTQLILNTTGTRVVLRNEGMCWSPGDFSDVRYWDVLPRFPSLQLELTLP